MNPTVPRNGFLHRLTLVTSLTVALTLLGSGIAYVAQSDAGTAPPERIDVRLRSGETIQNAAYVVDQRFKALRLTPDGGPARNISFSEIAAITSGGEDFTTQILGPGYGDQPVQGSDRPPIPERLPDRASAAGSPDSAGSTPAVPEGWLSESTGAYREARSPIWKAALRAGGNFSVPLGSYYEGVTSGIGFGGDVLIPFNHEIGILLSGSKAGIRWDEGIVRLVSLDPDFVILQQEFGITAVRYSVSGMVYKHLDPLRKDRSMLYAYGGVGVIRHKLTADFTLQQISTSNTVNLSTDDTETKFISPLGGGLVKTVLPGLGLDLSMNLDTIWAGSSSFAWIVDLRSGLVVFF